MPKQSSLGRHLVTQVRAAFVAQDTTLTEWCRKNEIHISAARQTLYGTWDGPKAKALRSRILKASGVKVAA